MFVARGLLSVVCCLLSVDWCGSSLFAGRLLCVVRCLLLVVFGLWFVVLFVVCRLSFVVCSLFCSLLFVLCSLFVALRSSLFVLCSPFVIICSSLRVRCSVFCVRCSLSLLVVVYCVMFGCLLVRLFGCLVMC